MVSLTKTLLVALPLALGVSATPANYGLVARQQASSCVPSSDIGTQADCYKKCTDAIANFLNCAGVKSCICNVLDTSLNVVDECITCGAVFPLVHEFIQSTVINTLLSCDNYKPPAQTPCETALPSPSPPVCDQAAAFAAVDPAQVTMCVGDPATYSHNIGDLGTCITDCLYAVFRAKECNGIHNCICSALNAVVSSVSQCFKCGTLYDEIHGLVEALLIPNLLACDLDPRPSTTYVICWSGTTTAVLPSGCTSIVPSGTSLATATATTAAASTSPASDSSAASAASSTPDSSAASSTPASSDASSTPASSASSAASSTPASSAASESAAASNTPASSAASSASPVSSSGLTPSGSCVPNSDIGTQADCYKKCTDAIANFLDCAGLKSCICNVLDTSLNVVDECITCGAVFPLVHDFIQNTVINTLLSCDNYKPPAQTPCETNLPSPSPPVCDQAAAFAAVDPAQVTMCVGDPATYSHNIGDLGTCIMDCLYAVFRTKECNGLHPCICSALNAVVSSVSQCFKCGTLYDEIHGLVEALLIPNLLACDLDPRPSTTYVICWSGTTTAVLPSGCTSIVPSGTSFATATPTTAEAITSPVSSGASATAIGSDSAVSSTPASSGGSASATGSTPVSSGASASASATDSSTPESSASSDASATGSSTPESSGASQSSDSSATGSSPVASSSAGSSGSASSASAAGSASAVSSLTPSGSCVPNSDIGTQADCYQKCTDAIANFLDCAGLKSCICNVLSTTVNVVDECITCGAVFPLVHEFIQNTVINTLLSCDNYKAPALTPCETAQPTPSPPVCDQAAAFAAVDPAQVTMCVADPATYSHNIGDLGTCMMDCLYAIFRTKECNGLHPCICSALNAVVSSVSQCFKCGTLYDEIHGLVEALLIPNLLACDLDPRPSTTYVICWSGTTTAVLPSGCTSIVPSGTSLATATATTSSGSGGSVDPVSSPTVTSASATQTYPASETVTITTTDDQGQTVTITSCPVCDASKTAPVSKSQVTEYTDVTLTQTTSCTSDATRKTVTITTTDGSGSTYTTTFCPDTETGGVLPTPPKTETITTTDEHGSTVTVTVCTECTKETPVGQSTVVVPGPGPNPQSSGEAIVPVPNPTGPTSTQYITRVQTITLTTTNEHGETVTIKTEVIPVAPTATDNVVVPPGPQPTGGSGGSTPGNGGSGGSTPGNGGSGGSNPGSGGSGSTPGNPGSGSGGSPGSPGSGSGGSTPGGSSPGGSPGSGSGSTPGNPGSGSGSTPQQPGSPGSGSTPQQPAQPSTPQKPGSNPPIQANGGFAVAPTFAAIAIAALAMMA